MVTVDSSTARKPEAAGAGSRKPRKPKAGSRESRKPESTARRLRGRRSSHECPAAHATPVGPARRSLPRCRIATIRALRRCRPASRRARGRRRTLHEECARCPEPGRDVERGPRQIPPVVCAVRLACGEPMRSMLTSVAGPHEVPGFRSGRSSVRYPQVAHTNTGSPASLSATYV